MFNNNYRRIDPPAQYKRQRKLLPFTVTAIGGPDDLKLWKQEQERKEVAWQANKAARHAAIAVGMEDGSLLEKQHYIASETTKAWKRYRDNIDTQLDKANRRETYLKSISKKPLFARIYDYILNLFLNTKFNQ